MTRSPLEDLPDHVQLKIYELVPPECRPSAEQAVPCFQEIARQRAQQRARQLGPAAPSGEVSERERVAVDRERETSPKSKPSAKKPAAPFTSVQQSAIDAAQSAAAAAEKARLDAGGGGEPTAGPKVQLRGCYLAVASQRPEHSCIKACCILLRCERADPPNATIQPRLN